ncbi:MAG TPA: hypothetical protein V6C85_30645 [Allocoleopsis sp.]
MSKIISWKWLLFSGLWYAVMGLNNAPFLAIGVLTATFAWSGAVVLGGRQVKRTMLALVFLTGAAVVAVSVFNAIHSVSEISLRGLLPGLYLFVFVALLLGLVTACIGGWILAGIWVLTKAGNQLLQSFSQLHAFLILSGTSWAGLGLGWLVNLIIQLKNLGFHLN